MMSKAAKKSCSQCPRWQQRVTKLEAEIRCLRDEVVRLQEQLAAAQKDSSTSSKPPSSDLVKPPAEGGATARPLGGQPGHAHHKRVPFAPEQVTHFESHTLQACPGCGGALRRNGPCLRVLQQMDIAAPPLRIEEHAFPEYWCDHCGHAYWAPLPLPLAKGGLVGPQLLALIAYLKGACHASFSTIRNFLGEVVQVRLSRGYLSKLLGKVSAALEEAYDELLAVLPAETRLSVDETGHPENGEQWWTWCFRAELYTLYRIDAHRSAEVLLDTLGTEFAGILGCDYFGAYRRYMKHCSVRVQFCLAHLIRDVKFVTTLPDAQTRAYGERLRDALRDLFAVVHEGPRVGSPALFQRRLQAARQRVLQAGLEQVPATRACQNLAQRFRMHGEAYFTFITTPGVEPTNNLAEQAIRFVVIDRHITQGTRSASGQRWCERIWTVIATCVQQGRSVYDYLQTAVANWFNEQPAPSLLPSGSSR